MLRVGVILALSLKKAKRLDENPNACSSSCLMVDERLSMSLVVFLMAPGQMLVWPATGRSREASCWQCAAYATVDASNP